MHVKLVGFNQYNHTDTDMESVDHTDTDLYLYLYFEISNIQMFWLFNIAGNHVI